MNSNVDHSVDKRTLKTGLDPQGPPKNQPPDDVTMKDAGQNTKASPGPIQVFVTNQAYGHSPYADAADTTSDPAPSTRVPSSPTISYVTASDDDDSDVDMTGTPPVSARRPEGSTAFPPHSRYGFPLPTFPFGLQGHPSATVPPALPNPTSAYQYGASPYQPGASQATPPIKTADPLASHIPQLPPDDKFPDSDASFISIPKTKVDELDLLHKIRGTYRLLDLYSENGSGGLGKPFASAVTQF